jgi:uncharacterized protein
MFQLMTLPALTDLARSEPRFPFKYLNQNYIARGLTVNQRAWCFLHHYKSLNSEFFPEILRRSLQTDVTLVEVREDGVLHSVSLGLSRREEIGQATEGELALKLKVDGTIIFVLAFTIVPGWVVESKAREVILISRLQGNKGCYPQICLATRALHDVAPAALLVAALQGIAEACDIREMAGVSAANQTNYSEDLSSLFQKNYDLFFAELGAIRTAANFFSSPLPTKEKPIALVKRGHKIRTKEKRAFKLRIAHDVCRLIRESC